MNKIMPEYITNYPNFFIFSNEISFAKNETEEITKVDI